MLVPARRRGVEILDDPATDPALRVRSIRDVARSNQLLGGARAVLAELARLLPGLGASATLLDVGTGLADIPRKARERARARGLTLRTFGLDEAESLALAAKQSLDGSVCGDARLLPLATASIDVITCSQLLHHFEDDEISLVLRELDRVARGWVVVSDLRRSWLAACGFWLVSWPLGFHRVTRHDGFVSVLRGFTVEEVARHVLAATGQRAEVRRHLGYRITATWRPRAASR
ncbi:MAG: methyltransferase domain-containing protein [Gemmatimonadaceae bacterium]